MSDQFRRALPARANLAQQTTQAKELLWAFAKGDPESLARVRDVLPDKPRIVLADAQFVAMQRYSVFTVSAEPYAVVLVVR